MSQMNPNEYLSTTLHTQFNYYWRSLPLNNLINMNHSNKIFLLFNMTQIHCTHQINFIPSPQFHGIQVQIRECVYENEEIICFPINVYKVRKGKRNMVSAQVSMVLRSKTGQNKKIYDMGGGNRRFGGAENVAKYISVAHYNLLLFSCKAKLLFFKVHFLFFKVYRIQNTGKRLKIL